MVIEPTITCLITCDGKGFKNKSKLQRLACPGISGAIRTFPRAAIEVLLGLPPLHFKTETESQEDL
jgi:hypothetical protein